MSKWTNDWTNKTELQMKPNESNNELNTELKTELSTESNNELNTELNTELSTESNNELNNKKHRRQQHLLFSCFPFAGQHIITALARRPKFSGVKLWPRPEQCAPEWLKRIVQMDTFESRDQSGDCNN